MPRILLHIIAFLFTCSHAHGQEKLNYHITETKAESLFFIDDTKSFIAEYLDTDINQLDFLTLRMELEETTYDELSIAFNKYLGSLPTNQARSIKKQMETWSKISTLINFPYDLDETGLLEWLEIISELEQTKSFVDQFIKVEGQYWGSLSSGQATVVYFETMEHLFKMEDKEKLKFFKDYYQVAYEKGQ
jgi:hypothetical protein